ncbi:MAG: DUF695 domain-containing protein [Brumimicrobium sp.]|nr:DUF695 domain-containing protein [Brumimicrobium sp.]
MGLFNFKKNKPEENRHFNIKGDYWNFYSYTYGKDMTALVEFDYQIAKEEHHKGYNSCKRVIIYIPLEKSSANGLPTKEESVRIHNLEKDLLSKLVIVDCKLVGKMSYGAMCDFIFQTNDSASFMKTVNKWISDQKSHRIEIIEKEGWEFFDTKIKPNHIFWQQISDRRTIGILIEQGTNPNKEHTIEHSFSGQEAILQSLRNLLTSEGFKLISMSDNRLILSKPAKLIGGDLSNLTQRLAGYSANIGAKYEGWGTKIEE